MSTERIRVCPVERAGSLDNSVRRWFQNPQKILPPYISPGMTVMDYGCGPGFFTMDMARMVGPTGQVIAVDLQKGMLDKLDNKIQGAEGADRVRLHQCTQDRIGVTGPIDFILAFYVVHEVPDHKRFYNEVVSILGPGGTMLIAEPPVHVSKAAFQKSIDVAREAGLAVANGPRVLLSKTAILKKE